MHSRAIKTLNSSILVRMIGATLLTAVGAQIAIHLPYTPAPVSWQVAGVLFAGLALGSRAGFNSQILYLALGFAGAPVFAFGGGGAAWLINPMGTGGYLIAFPLAAWVVGKISENGVSTTARQLIACSAGIATIYGVGCLWMSIWLHLSPAQALFQGAGVFVMWDAAKAMVVIAAMQSARGILKSEQK